MHRMQNNDRRQSAVLREQTQNQSPGGKELIMSEVLRMQGLVEEARDMDRTITSSSSLALCGSSFSTWFC